MFVEVQRRDEGRRSFLVNTDHVRSVSWETEGEGVYGVLVFSNGERVVIDLGPAEQASLWQALRELSGVALLGDILGEFSPERTPGLS